MAAIFFLSLVSFKGERKCLLIKAFSDDVNMHGVL